MPTTECAIEIDRRTDDRAVLVHFKRAEIADGKSFREIKRADELRKIQVHAHYAATFCSLTNASNAPTMSSAVSSSHTIRSGGEENGSCPPGSMPHALNQPAP